MLRWINALALCALVAVGCDRAQQSTRQEVVAEPEVPAHGTDGPHGAMPGSPHGMPPAGFRGMPGAEQSTAATGPEVDLGGKQMTAPETWVRKQTRSGMLMAEFSLPHVEGDSVDGRLTLMAVGGSIDANVDRWREQFVGKPKKESREQLDVAGIAVTLVDFSGAYNDQHGMSGPATESPDYRMRAAIFDFNGQQHIIKCYGPEKTMDRYADDFLTFVKSLGVEEKAAPKTETPEAKSPETESPKPEATDPAPGESGSTESEK